MYYLCLSLAAISHSMKYSEFHRKIRRSKSGWVYIGAEGSHYIYERNGVRYPVPYHGAKEMAEGLRRRIMKDMGLT